MCILKIFLWRVRKKLLSLMKNRKDQTSFLVKVHPDQIFAPRNRVLNFGTRSLLAGYTLCARGSLLSRNNLDKVFKNGTSKVFYRLSFTNFTWFIFEFSVSIIPQESPFMYMCSEIWILRKLQKTSKKGNVMVCSTT